MRILFTGGAGKAGQHVIRHLVAEGHRVTNADLVPAGIAGVADLKIDLTDAGQVFSAASAIAGFDELDGPPGVPRYDAIVHFAAMARILIVPDTETFRINTLSTYNVMETAVKLGIPKVIFASSETTYGICFADGEVKPLYIPVDEDHPTVPHDSYAMSKVANEVCGRSFQARSGIDIYGLRLNNVIAPEDYAEMFPAFLENADLRRRNIFGYIDTRDLGQMVSLCLARDGLGYEVFNVANADCSVAITSAEIRDRFYEGVELRKEMGAFETFYCIDKARAMLGYEPRHSWREVLE